MNNFPTVLPISAAFDSAPKPASQPETGSSSTDEFASMLASMWCGPAIVQTPTPEVEAVAETSAGVIAGEPGSSSTLLTPDVMSEVVAETVTAISDKLPAPTFLVDEKPLSPAESVSKMDTAVVAYPSDEVSKSVSTTPTTSETAGVPEVAQRTTRDLVRPFDQEPYADGVKTVSPVRRTPAFDIDLPGSKKPSEIKPLESQAVEVTVDSVEPGKVVPANTAKVAKVANVPNFTGDSANSANVTNVASVAPLATQPPPTDEVTAEAIRREANLAASYLAQSTRDSRENPLESIKAQVSGNGPEGKSNETGSEPPTQDAHSQVDLTSPAFASSLKKQMTDRTAEVIGPQVTREILELADTTPQRQTRTVRLRLRPEELGQVDVQLSRDASGKVSAQLLVERESARAALAQSLPQLRETLERAGLIVDRLQVSSETASFAGNARDSYRQSNDEPTGTSNNQSESLTVNETQTKERVRDHKLLSLSA